MTKFFLALLIAASLANSAFAKDYKIEELLQIAEQNSSIKAAEFLAIAQKRLANQQKYWDNPTVNFGQNSNQKNYSVSQAIPFYGKLQSKFDVEDSQYRILENQRNNLALFVKAETFSLLYQYYALQQKIELAQKRLARLSLVDKYLSRIVLSSPTQISQGRITKDKIKLIERDLMRFRNQLFQTWNKANVYLNLESEPHITVAWLEEKNYQGKKFFIEAALENNLRLKEQKFLLQKYRSELSFAKLEKMPDLSISATKEVASQASNGRDANGIGLSLSVPLFNRNQEKISGAESKIKAQEFEFEFQKNQLAKEVANDINEFETSLKIAKNFPVAEIDKTVARLNAANNEFKKGILDFITYIELDSQEYQIIDTILDTQVDLAASYASLMTKIGTFILPKNEQ
ncbi:MAG: TolC family protein [Rickettsiales bacterium]|nr:TolC family protein [Rickettsiales bacterium]